MDLAMGAQNVFVLMTLFSKDGSPKLVQPSRTTSWALVA
jgi:acyl CoA:acetate/3-ketoacid CoA transferase beta subunit